MHVRRFVADRIGFPATRIIGGDEKTRIETQVEC